MLEAGRCLRTRMATIDSAGTCLSDIQRQTCWDAYKRFLTLTRSYVEMAQPKRHLVLHMLRMLIHFGNLRLYATWRDESLNKTLKSSCRAVSQMTFEVSVLSNMKKLLELEPERKRKHGDAAG